MRKGFRAEGRAAMKRMLTVLVCVFAFARPAMAADEHVVARAMVDDRKAVIATVAPRQELLARARIGGVVAEVLVGKGAAVEAGARIALVADEKLALQLQALQARLLGFTAERDQAQTEFNRTQELRRAGIATQAALDQASTRLEVAQRGVQAARSERQVAEQQVAEGAVLAPGGGRVLRVPASAGAVILPGEVVAVIAAENFLLRIELPERHAQFMKVGDIVLVGARGMQPVPGETLREGRVALVYPEIDRGRVTAEVEVPGIGDYFVGERTRAYVVAGRRAAILVPERFVSRRAGVSFARLKDGTEVVVQPGAAADGKVEILAGLRAGDVVVAP
jgi:membrane fusion protein, multidrug efflux system